MWGGVQLEAGRGGSRNITKWALDGRARARLPLCRANVQSYGISVDLERRNSLHSKKYTFLAPEHCKCVGLGKRHTNAIPGKTILIRAPPIRPEGASGTLIPATPVRQIGVREIPPEKTLVENEAGHVFLLTLLASHLGHSLPDSYPCLR